MKRWPVLPAASLLQGLLLCHSFLVVAEAAAVEGFRCKGEYQLCADGSCSLGLCNVGCKDGEYLCPLFDGQAQCVQAPTEILEACRGVRGSHLDPSLTADERLERLTRAASLEEQVSQLWNLAPSIDRLGIPAYNWLHDALHGVQTKNATSVSTVFPNGNGLGATWNPRILRRVGAIIATEARGWRNSYIQIGDRGQESVWENGGITLYTPTINVLRDPRWGRAAEPYGEDPEHVARLAAEMVRGVQQGLPRNGSEDKESTFLAAATCKHFIANDQETFPTKRSLVNVNMSNRDLWESYMPPFKACAQEAKAAQVMCSFNLLNGVPACADHGLLTDVLRQQWGFQGSVVGDYDAWTNLKRVQNYSATWPQAVADGLNAGMDQQGGSNEVMNIGNVTSAIKQGLISREQVGLAFKRLFRARVELGMLDPPAGPGSPPEELMNLSKEISAIPQHLQVARLAAQESLCLYRNEKSALPLNASTLSRAADVAVVGPQAAVSGMLYGGYSGWAARSNWGASLLDAVTERLGHPVVHAPGCAPTQVSPGMPSGQTDIGVSCPTRDHFPAAFAAARSAKVVIVTLGLEFDNDHPHPSPTVEREEWDRTTIDMTENASALVLGLREANPNATLVAVLLHGGVFALPPVVVNALDAILDAWYPGIEGAHAIVDALFGDYNPGGRTPVTWYRSDKQLPMPTVDGSYRLPPLGLTYRFFDNQKVVQGEAPGPLFPFGFGLSYTTFRYSNLVVHKDSIGPCDALSVSVDVTNTGKRCGDEIVQVYASLPDASVPVPQVRLVAFQRVHIPRGETRQVKLLVPPRTHVAVLDGSLYDSNNVVVEKGRIALFVGGGQPNFFEGGLRTQVSVNATQALNDCSQATSAGSVAGEVRPDAVVFV